MTETATTSSLRTAAVAAVAIALVLLVSAPSAEAKLTSSFSAGVLTIEGDDGDDEIAVACGADGLVKVNGTDPPGGAVACARVVEVDALTGLGNDRIDFSEVGPGFGEAEFPGFGNRTGVAALGGAGKDRYIGSRIAFNLFDGEDGNDRARGGEARDQLVGGPDDDRLSGAGGRDSVLGNAGADRLTGGDGADVITGHAGPDSLAGLAGRDLLGGGAGNDRLSGGPGGDKLVGGGGRDNLRGGPGKDVEREN